MSENSIGRMSERDIQMKGISVFYILVTLASLYSMLHSAHEYIIHINSMLFRKRKRVHAGNLSNPPSLTQKEKYI